MAKAAPGGYGADQIEVLENLEHVRKRPGMYIGSTGSEGLHHLVYEIADNSVDEVLAGFCSEITVVLGKDKLGEWVSVQDNGRGIPIELNKKKKISTVRVVMEILGAGGKFGGDGSGYKVSGGLHGVGISVVNALSKRMEAHVVREGKKYGVTYENGGRCVDEYTKPQPKGNIEGTFVQFWADGTIFEEVHFEYDKLLRRFRQTAFLTPQVTVRLRDTRDGKVTEDVLHYENGLRDYIDYLVKNKKSVTKDQVGYVSGVANPGDPAEVAVDLALTYIYESDERVKSFANNIDTVDGGKHVDGFRSALTRALNEHGKATPGIFKAKDKALTGPDTTDGLIAVISVKLAEPQFEGQTKGKLGSGHVEGAVRSVVYDGLRKWLSDNPATAKAIIERCLATQRAREASKHEQDLQKTKVSGIASPLTGKLANCSGRNPHDLELFIVEGDSAGGSAKEARDRSYQAILPLRGKILNVEKEPKKMAANKEIQTILAALGTGIGKGFNIDNLKYHRVVIMTDADVDGDHIRTLLMTLFVRHFPQLVTEGHIWVARPPLYKLTHKTGKGGVEYVFTQQELRQKTARLKPTDFEVGRFKGLGEMNPIDLWNTTMDPEHRCMQQLVIDDPEYLDETVITLMNDSSQALAARKDFIAEYSRRNPSAADD